MLAVALAALILAGPPPDYSGLIWLESETCLPCKQMQPNVVELIVEGLPILVVSVAGQDELAQYGARVTPTTIAYCNGLEVERREGLLIEYTLREMLKRTMGARPPAVPDAPFPPLAYSAAARPGSSPAQSGQSQTRRVWVSTGRLGIRGHWQTVP